ncbi:MAG: hypothetical protein HEP71_23030 [Roseivirga sp.]|nr:hypothetical protein [Roseivirga sp.]
MSKILYHFVLLGLPAFASLSCGSDSSSNSQSAKTTQYELVKVDSIRIDKLEAIQITDYDAEKRRLLAYATSTKMCLEIDMEGNILSEVDLTGEGPGHFGMGLTELGYFGDGKIIHGPAVYFTYDNDWMYQSRVVYGASGYSLPLRYIDGAPIVMRAADENLLIRVVDHNAGGTLKLEINHFEQASMISVFRAGAEEGRALLRYPETSVYRRSELFYNSHQPKVSFNVIKNQLVLALPLEQKLYIYDVTSDFTLLETIDLSLTDFNMEPRGLIYEDQHKNSLKGFGPSNELNYVYGLSNSSILDVNSEGELTMVVHKTGFSNNAITSYQEANKVAGIESQTFTSFFMAGQKVYETDKRFPRLVRLSERQFIVPNINEEIERDYNQYDIYELSERIEVDR